MLSVYEIKAEIVEDLADTLSLKKARKWIEKSFKDQPTVAWDAALKTAIEKRSVKPFVSINDQVLEKIKERISEE